MKYYLLTADGKPIAIISLSYLDGTFEKVNKVKQAVSDYIGTEVTLEDDFYQDGNRQVSESEHFEKNETVKTKLSLTGIELY